ncbi:MAG: phage tail family protein [Ruthenibacterium sp.]
MSTIKTIRYINALGDVLMLDYAHGYVITSMDGVDTVSISASTAQGIGQIGATIQSRSIQPRPIIISGTICGDAQDECKSALQAAVLPDVVGTLYADAWAIEVIVTTTPVIGANKRYAPFQFQLTAPYPFWQSTAPQAVHLAGVQPLFKFPWNPSRAYRFGQRVTTKYAKVVNEGQTDCPLRITIDALGAASLPKIENLLTGEFLLLEKNLVAGERVVVDITHGNTVVVSSTDGDCTGALSLDSNLYRLHRGENILKPDAKAGLENLDISIEFAPECVGVVL